MKWGFFSGEDCRSPTKDFRAMEVILAMLCKLRRSSEEEEEEEEEEVAMEFGAPESVRTERIFVVFFVDMVWDMRDFKPLDFGD